MRGLLKLIVSLSLAAPLTCCADVYNHALEISRLPFLMYVCPARPSINVLQGGTRIKSGSGEFDFGGAGLCSSSTPIEFTIANEGTQELSLTGTPAVTLSGTDTASFSIDAQPASSVIAPGSSTTFTASFTPLARGKLAAAIRIPSSDTDFGDYTFEIAGTGQTPSGVIVYVSNVSGTKELWRMNPDGTHKQRITQLNNANASFAYPHISPDRTKVAVQFGDGTGSAYTYTVGIDSENPPLTRVSRSDFTRCYPGTWFADSQYLAYGGRENSSSNGYAWKVKYDGTGHELLFGNSLLASLNSSIQIVLPFIDTVNSRYAVVAMDTGGTFNEIYTASFDLSAPVKILDTYRGGGKLVWSSDGSKLQYSILSGSWYSNYYCNGDGSGQTSVPIIGSNATLWCWSPDMAHIIYGIGSSLFRADFPGGTNSVLLDSTLLGGADWK